MKNLILMMATGPDGVTFDPARVIGYGVATFGAAVFFGCTIWHVFKTGTFDPVAYGTGFMTVCGGVAAVALGVAAKASTEPKA